MLKYARFLQNYLTLFNEIKNDFILYAGFKGRKKRKMLVTGVSLLVIKPFKKKPDSNPRIWLVRKHKFYLHERSNPARLNKERQINQ